jgi:hypothetical protein
LVRKLKKTSEDGDVGLGEGGRAGKATQRWAIMDSGIEMLDQRDRAAFSGANKLGQLDW